MTVDISSEAFERLAKDCDRAQRDHDQWTSEAHLHFDAAATLRAQAERIKELEAENAILRTEKHADAEAIGALRDDLARFREDRPFVIGWNDGFEHGVKESMTICNRSYGKPLHHVHRDIAALTPTPQRCAECDCENGGDECTWIAPAKPETTPQEAAKVLWDMLQLSDGIPKIDQDAAQALWDRVQGAGGFYAVNEFLAELAGIDTGEDSQ